MFHCFSTSLAPLILLPELENVFCLFYIWESQFYSLANKLKLFRINEDVIDGLVRWDVI